MSKIDIFFHECGWAHTKGISNNSVKEAGSFTEDIEDEVVRADEKEA